MFLTDVSHLSKRGANKIRRRSCARKAGSNTYPRLEAASEHHLVPQSRTETDSTRTDDNNNLAVHCIGDSDDPDDDGELELGVFDISRAHFMPKT